MQLHKINDYIEQYKVYLNSFAASKNNLHYWESQRIWQQNWDKNAINWHKMYDQCLQNSTTKRLWKRTAYEPKAMMLTFLKMDQHFVFAMFDDLFDNNKEVLGRADRFVFYCHQLMAQYGQQNPTSKAIGHHHDDGYQMIALYLSFQFPDLYAPYQAEDFNTLLQKIGAVNIPLAGDFSRHFKVMRTLQKFLHKDESLLQQHKTRLREQHYQEESLLLAFDFAQFIVHLQEQI